MSEQLDHASTLRLGTGTLGPPMLSLDYRQVGAIDRRRDVQQVYIHILQRLDALDQTVVAIHQHLTRPPWWQRLWWHLTSWRS